MGRGLVLVCSAIFTTLALPGADADSPPPVPSGPYDLGTLGGNGSIAVAIDGPIAVGYSATAPLNRNHAFAYDLSAPNPTMLDLGTLANGRTSMATDVSGHVVVGDSDYSNQLRHAFYYDLDDPGMVDMGNLGAAPSEAVAIDGSVIVGWSSTPDGGPAVAYYWDLAAASPTMTPIADVNSQALDVSDGVIVGKAGLGAGGQDHAFYYDMHAANPALVDLSPTPTTYSEAQHIDDGVVIVYYIGSNDSGMFAYDLDAANPTLVDPGTFGGTANAINDVSNGVIVGGATDADEIAHAFAYDIRAADPQLIDLGYLGMGAVAEAIDGDIVTGTWYDAGFYPHAFVYDLGDPNAVMTDLGTLGGNYGVPFDVSGHLVAGYSSTAGDTTAHATVWPMPTTTALDSSTNPSVTGDQVTFTASISPQPDGGVVAFTDGASEVAGCTSSPVDAVGQATCTTTLSSMGNHSIGATYSGTLEFGSSSAPGLTQEVDVTTTTSIGSSGSPALTGTTVTYTATVSPTPSGGTVDFTDGLDPIADCAASTVDLGTGEATCSVTYSARGTHSVTASFSGDGFFLSSSSGALSQQVNSPTATTLAASANPAIVQQSVVYTATVSPAPSSGSVAFQLDGAPIATCATRPLDASGAATCAVAMASLGTHSVDASYSGAVGFAPSTATTWSESVGYGVSLLYDPTVKSKSGATVSLKAMLVNATGQNLSAPLTTLTVTGMTPGPAPGLAPTGTFSYSVVKKAGQYAFSFKTTKYPAGNYGLTFTATGDPVSHTLPFAIK